MTASRLGLPAFIAIVLLQTAPVPAALERGAAAAQATEELIADKDPAAPLDDDEDMTSLDGRRVAWRTVTNKNWSVMLNGVPQGGTFDEVRSLRFSPDNQHLAFSARRNKQWFLVLDGAASSLAWDDIGAPVFSLHGGRMAYAAQRDKRWTIVEDGKESGAYANVGLPEFSEDGKHIAYRAKAAKKWTVVVDGQPQGGEFDEIVARRFSPDGQRGAYVGRRGGKYVSVLDGKEGPPFDIVGGLEFSSDSRRFAYAGIDVHQGFGKQKATGRAVIDGVAAPEFEGGQIGSLIKSMATGSIPQLVLGFFWQLFSETHGITAPVFSPDSRRVAYAARRDKDAVTVIVDGEPGPAFASIVAGPVFSPDSQHLAFVVSEGGTKTLMVDGVKVGRGSESGTDFVSSITFAPRNQRVAYVGITGGSWYERGFTARAKRRVYVDGIAHPEYNAQLVGRLQFTPDGKHLTYVVARASEASRDVSFVVIDGVEGKRYDYVYGSPRLASDGQSVNYTVQAGRKFYLVTQPLEQTAPM